MLEVVNIVSTTNLGMELDLELLSVVLRELGDVLYDEDKFPGLIVRTGRVAYLVFRTGRVVVVGCRSLKEVEDSVRRLAKVVSSVVSGVSQKLVVQVQNVVVTADLGRELDLEELSERLSNSVYMPEEFPGLIYRPGAGRPSALVFGSGRVVVVGSTSVEEAEELVREIGRVAGVMA